MAAVKQGAYNGDMPKFTIGGSENGQDIFETTSKQEEIRNIQNLIRLTKEKLEAINAEFGIDPHPPSLYLDEYNELTTKIHELQEKEDALKDQLPHKSLQEPTPSELPTPPRPYTTSLTSPEHSQAQATAPEAGQTTDKANLKSLVRVQLPNQQKTTFQVKPGIPLKEALGKAMKRRELIPESCIVYMLPKRSPVSWDVDISALAAEELVVEIKKNKAPTTRLSHNFVRKTFFVLAFCDSCRRILFQGFRCQTCGYKFHQRCADRVPALCQQDTNDVFLSVTKEKPFSEKDMLEQFKHLLADPNGQNAPQLLPLPSSPVSVPRSGRAPPLERRDRANSAPNVSCHVNMADIGQEEYVRRIISGAPDPFPRPNFKDKNRHASDSSAPARPSRHFQYATISRAQGLTVPAGMTPQSPASSPTKSQSTNTSPTNTKPWRHRSGSDQSELGKKLRRRRDSNEDWEIPMDEIEYHTRIGSGSYGTVFKGFWHGPIAIKKLNVVEPTPAQMQAFKNEVAVLRKTRHVNILLFMGCVSKPELAIVTQWCEGSSLYKHLHVLESKFDMIQLIDIARQTAQGMDYLHAKFIIHRDLKTNNIFLHDDLTVKIGDFGLATVKTRWSGSHQFQQPTGSILWMAPEVIRMKEENPYTFNSDVYAFGIVSYELITGQLPYQNISNKDQILFMVGKGYLKPDMSKVRTGTPKAFKRLMEDCCKFIRDERPLFPQILASLESLVRNMPKLHRSQSEPTLNRTHLQSDDFDIIYQCASPKTPIGQYGAFNFFNSSNMTAY
ncbi:serine/threonine-protein kinase B-raf isoform X2 [Lingula anatina]|uniref:non-specific serine/threonine protein kinase n=1 Tax=Lingula anatina TaxID=7574 RepID=A0A1S3JB12_LINAN|nr:serine/threonine-protein kinase B-raf isoform X1 [Lingula anatina]XP_023933528.1 serine/threonine-protein kinase B-raf isoform X2 [Lingula anatina]|eukprot:XP_013407069.1 serine/threonine-protein kinase B-raf isoform X1 [Lingula anatina]